MSLTLETASIIDYDDNMNAKLEIRYENQDEFFEIRKNKILFGNFLQFVFNLVTS